MKLLGIFVLLLGALLMIFAVMAYFELRDAATSNTPVPPNAMPLTKIVGPELFDPASVGSRPSDLARMAVNRIYGIGGVSLLLLALGTLFCVIKASPRSNGNRLDRGRRDDGKIE